MTRALFFFVIAVIGFAGPAWLFAVGLLLYGYWYSGYEIIGVAFLVDALFMKSGAIMPFYTIGVSSALIVFELVKPHISLYNQRQ